MLLKVKQTQEAALTRAPLVRGPVTCVEVNPITVSRLLSLFFFAAQSTIWLFRIR